MKRASRYAATERSSSPPTASGYGPSATVPSVATMLARSKLYDCQHDLLKKGFSIGDYDEEGNFDVDLPAVWPMDQTDVSGSNAPW